MFLRGRLRVISIDRSQTEYSSRCSSREVGPAVFIYHYEHCSQLKRLTKSARRPPVRDEKPVLVVPVARSASAIAASSFSRSLLARISRCRTSSRAPPYFLSPCLLILFLSFRYTFRVTARPLRTSLNGGAKVNGTPRRKGQPVDPGRL